MFTVSIGPRTQLWGPGVRVTFFTDFQEPSGSAPNTPSTSTPGEWSQAVLGVKPWVLVMVGGQSLFFFFF